MALLFRIHLPKQLLLLFREMLTEQSSIGDKVIETLAKECLLSQTLFENGN